MSRITFISRMTIKPGREQDFVDACNELTAKVKAHEPGVIYYEFFKLREPRRYAVLESFPSEETEHAHMNSAGSRPSVPASSIASTAPGSASTWIRSRPDAFHLSASTRIEHP